MPDRRARLAGSLAVLAAVAALTVLAGAGTSAAQAPGRIPRIGFLGTNPSAYTEAVIQALARLGYVPGRTVDLDFRYTDGRIERFPELAAALVDRRVDVLVASSDPATRAAKRATATIPIVMLVGEDPVAAGFAASLTRPDGNVTGISTFQPDLVAKRLQLLQELVPGVSRIAVLGHAADPMVDRAFIEAEKASHFLKLTVRTVKVAEPEELDEAFAKIATARPHGLLVLQNFWMYRNRQKVVDLTVRSRLPAVYGLRDYVSAGGLMSYAPDYVETYTRAVTYIDKILKGAKPGDLPIERSTKFELAINLGTARALGLTVPPPLLQRADQVIQ